MTEEIYRKAGGIMRKKKSAQIISNEVLCAEYEAVYRYLFSLCRNEAEAQDITQETFLKAMKAAESFEGNSSLYTWLCAIAKNLWLNRCKKQSHEVLPENIADMKPDNETPIEQRVVEKEAAMHIHKVLHDLNEPYKEVFSLRVFGQLSFAEIASLFSKTESWARVTYHRARKMISEKMRKDGYYE